MALRIGVNALYLIPGGVGGTEIYLRNLLRTLAEVDTVNRYLIVTNRETTDLVPEAPNMQAVRARVAGRVRPARILWEQIVLPLVAARRGFDVLFNPGFTAPLVCPCPQLTVFHDLQHKRHPENFRWFDLPFWNFLLRGSAMRSTRLMADSEATRQDLRRYYGVDASVVPVGIDPAFFDIASQRAPEPFFLCVSTLHPHKGIEDLLAAFARFLASSPGYRLVLAGMRGFAAEAIERRIGELGISGSVEITGWIARDRLYELYRTALALVYPSRFEGFGMPVSEAMAAGVPVACSDIEPLRSVAADAALLFTPGDESSICRALETLANDGAERARLAETGMRRAAEFQWPAIAARTVSLLEETAASHG